MDTASVLGIVFYLVVLIFSAILHEIAHGYVAELLGDSTARDAGRLTLNPLKHLDPYFSVLLPGLLLLLSGGRFAFGGAKPVPYNPNNLKNPRTGALWIALAGPATNFLLAIIFGIFIRVLVYLPISTSFVNTFGSLLEIIVFVNLLLGVFNLIPIPPLDGSRLLFAVLPQTQGTYKAMYFMQRYGLILVVIFAFFGFQYIVPLIGAIFTLVTGQPSPF